MTRPGRDLAKVLKTGAAELAEGQPILQMEHVSLSFFGLEVLHSITLDVKAGELFAIIGPNGAGKTSIFNCLSGVYQPDEGSIRFLGKKINGVHPHRIAGMGMARTFQNIELFRNLSLLDNLMLGRHQHLTYGPFRAMWYLGRTKKEEVRHRAIVEEIIEFLEIEQYRSQPVGLLPYGIQKRIELGRALAMEPKMLLLDEPVAGMNSEETEDMARFILDIREELDLSILLVEHDMGLVMDIADRVLVLDFGEPVAMDIPSKVQTNPDVIKAYLGEQHAVART